MVDDETIIEAEVLSESAAEPAEQAKPKKVAGSDHSKQVGRYAMLSRVFLRIGRGPMFLFAVAGLVFSILFQNHPEATSYLVLLIVFWSLALFCLLSLVLGYVFRRFQISHMKQDPNYDRFFE